MLDKETIPFDPAMCINQFTRVVGLLVSEQGNPVLPAARKEAERRCSNLVEEFFEAQDGVEFFVMLCYLAVDLAVNIAHMVDCAQIHGGDIDTKA